MAYFTVTPFGMRQPCGQFFQRATDNILGTGFAKLEIQLFQLVRIKPDNFILFKQSHLFHNLTLCFKAPMSLFNMIAMRSQFVASDKISLSNYPRIQTI